MTLGIHIFGFYPAAAEGLDFITVIYNPNNNVNTVESYDKTNTNYTGRYNVIVFIIDNKTISPCGEGKVHIRLAEEASACFDFFIPPGAKQTRQAPTRQAPNKTRQAPKLTRQAPTRQAPTRQAPPSFIVKMSKQGKLYHEIKNR